MVYKCLGLLAFLDPLGWQYLKKKRELCSTLCRNIWNQRNLFLFEGKFESPRILNLQAQSQVLNFQATQQSNLTIPTPSDWARKRQLPPLNTFKVNWDTALDISSKAFGLGGIARNELGQVLASFCFKPKAVSNPIIAEAQALKKSMLICAELGFKSLLFEGECLDVVNWTNFLLEPPPYIRPIIFDIRNLLQLHTDWKISFTHREANFVAHILAKMACNVSSDCIWIEECPSNVRSYVLLDLPCDSLQQWLYWYVSYQKIIMDLLPCA